MSNGKTRYKRNPLDFIHGTMNLSLEEKGAYSLILDLIYSRGEPIADDGRYLAGVCNVSLKKWFSLRDSLIRAGKIFIKDGFISNIRAQKELEAMRETSQKLSESGAKGGQKRAENSRNCAENSVKTFETSTKTQDKFAENEHELNKNNDLGQARLKHTRVKNRIDISSLCSDISYAHFRENEDFDEIEDLGNPPAHSKSASSPPVSEPSRQRTTATPSTANSPPKAAARQEMPDERRTPQLTEAKTQKAQVMREFDDVFWPAFANKKAKIKARTDFVKARKKAGLAEIMAGLERYQASLKAKGTDRRFWLHPTTFLNQERWTDEPDPDPDPDPNPSLTGEKNHERDYRNSRRQEQSRGAQIADLWVEFGGNQQSGEETGEHISNDFLPRKGINSAGESLSERIGN